MSIEKIGGIIPPLVTPVRADGTIDEQAHRTEVRHMVERAGVHGLAVCGSTGEGHTLSTDETRRIVGWTVEEVKGRVPVIAGIITDSTQATIERAKAVADLGVAALQVTPVHYVFRPDDDSMVRHFGAIADQTGIPVIIYNVVPWSYLLPPLLVRILREVEGVIGVKQSASDMKALADLLLLSEEAGIREPGIPLTVWEDNTACIHLGHGLRGSKSAKHFEVRLRFLNEQVHGNVIEFAKIDTKDQLADGFTKAFPGPAFFDFRNIILRPQTC